MGASALVKIRLSGTSTIRAFRCVLSFASWSSSRMMLSLINSSRLCAATTFLLASNNDNVLIGNVLSFAIREAVRFACFGALVPMESGGGEGGDGNGGGDADDAAGVEGGGISGVDGVNGGGDADDAAGVEGGGISGIDGVNGAAGEEVGRVVGSCIGCVKKKEPT